MLLLSSLAVPEGTSASGTPMQPASRSPSKPHIVSGGYSDARAAIVDEGTQDLVGGKPCGTYLIFSMQRSASTTLCLDVNRIDGHDFRCAFELFGNSYSRRHHYDQDWVTGHPKEFLLNVANQSRTMNDACVWGFKLFDRQLENVEPILSEVDKCIIYRCAGRSL